jgi:hypothetical protein
MSQGDDRRFAPADAASWTDAGGELLIFDRERGSYHALNGTGSRIWRAMGEGAAQSDIVARLAAEFDADPAVISGDVAEFLARGVAGGLIVER